MTKHHRIVALLIFLCGALIASLFIYHTTHQPPLIKSDNAVIFPVPRDIQPFSLTTTENKSFSNKDLLNHWTILFFGFTHCSSICPATLEQLGYLYPALHAAYPNIQIVFVTLDPSRDTITTLTHYLRSIHPALIGATGKINVIRKLQGQFGIFSASDPSAENPTQLQHTPTLILINPKGQWKAVINHSAMETQQHHAQTASPIDAKPFVAVLQQSAQSDV